MTERGVDRYPYLHRQTMLISIHHRVCTFCLHCFPSKGSRGSGLNSGFVGLYRQPFLSLPPRSFIIMLCSSVSTLLASKYYELLITLMTIRRSLVELQ